MSLGINRLINVLYEGSEEAGDVPVKRFRDVPPEHNFDPHILQRYGDWRTPGSSYIINEYTFIPAYEVTDQGEVFDLYPETLKKHYSLTNSPDEFADSLSA